MAVIINYIYNDRINATTNDDTKRLNKEGFPWSPAPSCLRLFTLSSWPGRRRDDTLIVASDWHCAWHHDMRLTALRHKENKDKVRSHMRAWPVWCQVSASCLHDVMSWALARNWAMSSHDLPIKTNGPCLDLQIVITQVGTFTFLLLVR